MVADCEGCEGVSPVMLYRPWWCGSDGELLERRERDREKQLQASQPPSPVSVWSSFPSPVTASGQWNGVAAGGGVAAAAAPGLRVATHESRTHYRD